MVQAPATAAEHGALYALDSGLTTLRSAAVSASGSMAVTYGVDALVYSLSVWDLNGDVLVRRIETDQPPVAARFTPDESAIVAVLRSMDDDSAEVVRWELSGSDDRGEVIYSDSETAGAALSRDAQTVVFRSRRSGLTVLDVATGTASRLGRSTPFERVAVAPYGTIIAATTRAGIEAYERPSGSAAAERLVTIPREIVGQVQSMDCSPETIVAASGDSVAVVYGPGFTDKFIASGPVRRLALGTRARVLAVAQQSTISLVDLMTAAEIMQMPTASPVERLTFSLDDSLLVTAHADNIAWVWKAGPPPGTMPGTPLEATSPDESVPDAVRYGREPVGRDFYTLIDTAGYAAYAEAITRAIQHDETRPPLTIGIKGTWGAGKTSLMRMVQQGLEWPAGEPPGSAPQLRPIKLTPQARALTAVQDTPAGELQVVRNKTILQRLRALRQQQAPGSEAGEPGKIAADPVAPARSGPDPDDTAWRPTVWFNPWMYQNGEQVWAGLAYEIIKQITERMSIPERENFWLRLNLGRVDEQAVRRKIYSLLVDRLIPVAVGALVCVVIGVALLAVHVTRWVTVSLAGGGPALLAAATAVQWASILRSRVSGSLSQLVQPMGAAQQFTSTTLHGAYDELVSSPDYLAKAGFFYFVRADVQRVLDLVATDRRPLVVFVDDLDRCSPGTVVQVIEAINLFLAGEYPNSIFVIAMEPEMVAAHIEAAYSDLVKALADTSPPGLGWRFLEKIVQLPLALPAMESARKASYIESLLTGAAPAAPAPAAAAEVEERLNNLAGASLAEAVHSSQAAPADAADAQALRRIIDRRLSDDSEEIGAVISFAAPHLATNPREIKRFVNLFRFLVMIDSERGLQGLPSLASLQAIAKLAVLHLRWPDLLGILGRTAGSGTGRTVYEVLEQPTAGQPAEPDHAAEPPADHAAELAGSDLSDQAMVRLTAPGLQALIRSGPPIGEVVRHYL